MDPQHQPGDLSHQSGQASFNPPQFGQTAQFGQVSQPGQQLPGFSAQHTQVQQPSQFGQPGHQLEPRFPAQHTQVQQPGQLNPPLSNQLKPRRTCGNKGLSLRICKISGITPAACTPFRHYQTTSSENPNRCSNTCEAICLPRHHPRVPLDFADRVRARN